MTQQATPFHLPFRGFLTGLLNEAFYNDEVIPHHMTEPDNISSFEDEDPCDQQQFIKSFLGKGFCH